MDSATKPTPSILIVEDDEATRVGLYHLLSGNGYRVQAATNGREALSLLQNNAIPLILSDLNMPVHGWLRAGANPPQSPLIQDDSGYNHVIPS